MRWLKHNLYFFLAAAVILLAAALWATRQSAAGHSKLRIHILDVGYGDCILIQTSDNAVYMVDAGERPHTQKIIQYLISQNIRSIDTAVISHPHANHFEGFWGLSDHFFIKQVFVNGDSESEGDYAKLLSRFRDKGIPVRTIKAGESLKSPQGHATVLFLHPDTLSGSPNDNSLVGLLTYKGFSALLTADVMNGAQERLLRNNPGVKAATVVQIPHHGSPISDLFAEYFRGKTFVLSTGTNRWDIVHDADLEKLEGDIWRTDRQGTILIETDGKNISIQAQK